MTAFECPYCSAALADAGQAFVDHLQTAPDCYEPWLHHAQSSADEWSKR